LKKIFYLVKKDVESPNLFIEMMHIAFLITLFKILINEYNGQPKAPFITIYITTPTILMMEVAVVKAMCPNLEPIHTI
jgi:hypothetical protein